MISLPRKLYLNEVVICKTSGDYRSLRDNRGTFTTQSNIYYGTLKTLHFKIIDNVLNTPMDNIKTNASKT